MLRAAKNEVLQAEREVEAAKAKAKFVPCSYHSPLALTHNPHSVITKDLTSVQTAHNRTSVQLAQTTSANAALRAASAADLRKREQDVARLKERWQKLAGEQAKLGTVGSGIVCSNWAVAVNDQYVGVRGEGEEAAEGAMRDAIEARERLAEANDEFREVFVKLINVVGEGLREKEVSLSFSFVCWGERIECVFLYYRCQMSNSPPPPRYSHPLQLKTTPGLLLTLTEPCVTLYNNSHQLARRIHRTRKSRLGKRSAPRRNNIDSRFGNGKTRLKRCNARLQDSREN
jgi:hypothetical protein